MDYIKSWIEVIIRPSDFYKKMSTTGGYTEPLSFAAISLIINSLLLTYVRPFIITLVGMHESRPSVSILSTVIIIPLEGLVGLLILALVFNLIYHLKVIGGRGSHEGTLRFISYASALNIFTWIPILGIIFAIYHFYIYIVGGMIVQNLSLKKSTIAVLPLFILYLYFAVHYTLRSFAH